MLRKNRKLPIIAGSLAAVALMSVGFSAWLISGQAQESIDGNVSLTVGEVNDRRLLIVLDDESARSLVFDAEGTTPEGGKIRAADTAEQNLSITVGFTVGWASNYENGAWLTSNLKQTESVIGAFSSVKFTFTPTTMANEYKAAMNDAIACQPFGTLDANGVGSYNWEKGALSGVTYGGSDKQKYSASAMSETEATKTVHASITFNWAYGSFFNYANPTQYVGNDLDTAVANLRKLNAVSTATFTLKLETL